MSSTSSNRARILLKARPTPEQLRDRLAEPRPEGIELYLDVSDITGDSWLAELKHRVAALELPSHFDWVVEGPLRSLDGKFFDISCPTPANVEVLRRLTSFGRAIGAKAAVIHAIALAESAEAFAAELAEETLQKSLAALRLYADLCLEAGLVPTIENVPPVTQMRESRFMHSLIGMEPADLLYLTSAVQGLKITLDVSHAQLYLNAASASGSDLPREVVPLIGYLSSRRQVATIDEYIAAIEHLIFEVHFSNARGLAAEGLPYDDGDLDLDELAVRLQRIARFLVTETIEPNPDEAVLMREAQRRMKTAIEQNDGISGRGRGRGRC